MKRRYYAIALLCVLLVSLLCGCGTQASKSANQSYYSESNGAYYDADEYVSVQESAASGYWAAEEAAEVPEPERAAGQSSPTSPAKLIYTASLDMETLEFSEAVQALATLTAECGGYYESSSISDQGNSQRAYFTVRVPSDKFRDFVDSAGALCHLLNAQEYVEDVSEYYYDTEGHLRTQQIKLERLQALLEEAKKMEDIIVLESAISETEEKIESLSGTLRHYDALVDYATVSISLREVKVYEPEPPETFGSRLASAFTDGWHGFLEGLGNIVVALAYSWLWLVLIAAIIVVIVKLVKRHRARKPAKEKKRRFGRKNRRKESLPEPESPAPAEEAPAESGQE